MFNAVAELSDVISFAIFCPTDNALLLVCESNEYQLPSSKVYASDGWFENSTKHIEEIIGASTVTCNLLKLYRIWAPGQLSQFVYNCIYYLFVVEDQKNMYTKTEGKYRGKVNWVQEQELQKLFGKGVLRSSEILELYQICRGKTKIENISFSLTPEFINCGTLVEVTNNILIKDANSNPFNAIVTSASFNIEVQTALLKQYLLMCYPALFMTLQTFTQFIQQLGWTKEECFYLFKASDLSSRWGLSFREFLYSLAVIEPTTAHGGQVGELRCRYIFRFFDYDGDGVLNVTEMKNMITAIHVSKKQPINPAGIAEEVNGLYQAMKLNIEKQSVSITNFIQAIAELHLRGTSHICRSNRSVLEVLRNLQDEQRTKLALGSIELNNKAALVDLLGAKQKGNGICVNYEWGIHSIKLQKSGTIIKIEDILQVTPTVSISSTHYPFRRNSRDQFDQQSISNNVLKTLRYLAQVNRTTIAKPAKSEELPPYSWGQVPSKQFGDNLISLCKQAKNIIMEEPRLLDIRSPVYIMGDLHGNLHSLLYFERILWNLGVGLCPANLLFLGDFVDRGYFGVEIIAYIFAYKVQMPSKLFLVRGNHEIREIQLSALFFKECAAKFGKQVGPDVWNAVNNVFDCLPIAAAIDNKIFCCHGGVPPPWLCPTISAINKIPCPLNNPAEQSKLSWELMWNDPVSNESKITEKQKLELQTNSGFATNTRRGTAHVFSVEALEKFLNTNNFSHFIRAHEVIETGFNVIHRGKLLTVFSSANYCGGTNEAACILADQDKLRIIRLDAQ